MIKLTWWELDELEEVFEKYNHLWTFAEGLWCRWVNREQDTLAFVVQVLPSASRHRFSCGEAHVRGQAWGEESQAWFESFLRKHTSYGERIEAENVLRTELGMTAEHAALGAIVMSHVFNIGPVLAPVIVHENNATGDPQVSGNLIGSLPFVRNGWMRLRYTQSYHLVHVQAWLPWMGSDNEAAPTGNYVTGFLHVPNGVQNLHAAIYGEDDIDERELYGASRRVGAPSRPEHADRGEAERGEGLPELPQAVRVAEGGEPDAGQATLAAGVRERDAQVPAGEGEGRDDGGGDAGGEDPAVS